MFVRFTVFSVFRPRVYSIHGRRNRLSFSVFGSYMLYVLLLWGTALPRASRWCHCQNGSVVEVTVVQIEHSSF